MFSSIWSSNGYENTKCFMIYWCFLLLLPILSEILHSLTFLSGSTKIILGISGRESFIPVFFHLTLGNVLCYYLKLVVFQIYLILVSFLLSYWHIFWSQGCCDFHFSWGDENFDYYLLGSCSLEVTIKYKFSFYHTFYKFFELYIELGNFKTR